MSGSSESELESGAAAPDGDWSVSIASIASDWDPPEIDPTVPHPFRMYNYLIGGKDHYQADRDAVEVLLRARPDAVISARAVEAFSRRVVRYLAGTGITQFLQLGTAITVANSHDQIAQTVEPTCRFIYVADDPITLAHARALLVGRPGSDVTVVAGDFRAPERVLADPNVTAHLELDRPVGVLLFGMLDYIRDPRLASEALATLVDWVPPGSMIALQHVQEVGMAEVDASIPVDIYPTAAAYQAGQSQDYTAWKKTGLGYVAVGLGAMYAVTPSSGVVLELRGQQLVPTAGAGAALQLGYAIGF